MDQMLQEKNAELESAKLVAEKANLAKSEFLSSTGKFTHVWVLENGDFKLTNGLSYNHEDFEKPFDENLLFKDKSETERWLKQKQIPALGIGYIKDGKILQISVFGELETNSPAPTDAIWDIASLTKPITALVALKLVNAEKWDLDEPVYRYYMDSDIAKNPRTKLLTTRIILSHQTGFPNWRGNNTDGKLSFDFEPGTKYQYSGEGYEYLRKALENKFDKSLEQLAGELIFMPLNMKDTRFFWNNEMDSTKFARWHNEKGELYETQKNRTANAADNLLTTVEDYSKFLVHIMNGAGLSDKLYKEMIADHVRINDYKHFGLGWWIDQNINENNDFALVHGGDDIGVHTIAFIVPKTKQALLIFTNCDNGTDAFAEILVKFFGTDGEGILNIEMK
jgi:CubicO group peptidase (beta-lactamase class C family)